MDVFSHMIILSNLWKSVIVIIFFSQSPCQYWAKAPWEKMHAGLPACRSCFFPPSFGGNHISYHFVCIPVWGINYNAQSADSNFAHESFFTLTHLQSLNTHIFSSYSSWRWERGVESATLCVPCCCSFSFQSKVTLITSINVIYSTIYSGKCWREEDGMWTEG